MVNVVNKSLRATTNCGCGRVIEQSTREIPRSNRRLDDDNSRLVESLSKLPQLFLKSKHALTSAGNNMEIDINVNDILREVIMFLECLRDAQLPLTLESLREKLLVRSKNTLSVTTMARASSPEPYLDMKSGPRSLLLTRNEADSEEYVGMEESQKDTQTHPRAPKHAHQDYYETFENDGETASTAVANEYPDPNDNRDESQMLIGIYKSLSAMQVRSKCYKCGPLYRKEGKKLFLSTESRACWIALVGSHLLIYRSERHNRPYAIYSIRGYMARPAPNIIPRDRRKSESAFEIYSPGNETLQFIARTPKDMDQWIAKICEMGCRDESGSGSKTEAREKKRRIPIVESPITDRRKGDEAEKSAVVDELTVKAESASNKNEIERKDTGSRAPPLPARIPRRLPSLPLSPDNSLTVPSYRVTVEADDDDDDDIYHRIEDLRNETRYQNMVLSKTKQANASDERREEAAVAYDDVRAPNERNERDEKKEEQVRESRDAASFQEMYDDIITLSRCDVTSIEPDRKRNNDASIIDGVEREEEFYDDVESLIPNRRFIKDYAKDQIEMSRKLEKRSFLDRVLSRRESSGKSDKRCKGKVSSRENPSSSSATEEMPSYDDVSDLTSNQEPLVDEREELSEYNCPPPPRPIYEVKSPARSQNLDETEEFYDDVSAYQEGRDENHQQIMQSIRNSRTKVNEAVHNGTYNIESKTETKDDEKPAREEVEHYQSPRSDSCIRDAAEMEQNEQLYDDIALWADFTARQRDIVRKRESEDAKSVSSDKKAWNRFAVHRKSRVTNDFNCSNSEMTNKRVGGNAAEGDDEIEDPLENNGTAKRNTFQKLISRMENSLAKVSARSPSSLSTGKSNASSNNS